MSVILEQLDAGDFTDGVLTVEDGKFVITVFGIHQSSVASGDTLTIPSGEEALRGTGFLIDGDVKVDGKFIEV